MIQSQLMRASEDEDTMTRDGLSLDGEASRRSHRRQRRNEKTSIVDDASEAPVDDISTSLRSQVDAGPGLEEDNSEPGYSLAATETVYLTPYDC